MAIWGDNSRKGICGAYQPVWSAIMITIGGFVIWARDIAAGACCAANKEKANKEKRGITASVSPKGAAVQSQVVNNRCGLKA